MERIDLSTFGDNSNYGIKLSKDNLYLAETVMKTFKSGQKYQLSFLLYLNDDTGEENNFKNVKAIFNGNEYEPGYQGNMPMKLDIKYILVYLMKEKKAYVRSNNRRHRRKYL